MRLFLFAMVLAAVSADASAQSAGSLGEGKAGLFTFYPGLVFSSGHDTNPYREAGAEADIETYMIPQVTGWFTPGRLRTNFYGAIEVITFANRVGARNHQFGVRNEWQGTRLVPYVDFNSRHTNANPTGFEVGRKSMRIEHALQTGLRTRLGGRVSLAGFYHRTRTNWDADAIYQTSSLREKLNRTDVSAGGRLEMALTPLTTVRFTGERSTNTFEFSPGRDGSGTSMAGGITMTGPAAITGSADVGYRTFTSASHDVKFRGLFSSMALSRTFPSDTVVMVGFSRDMQFSYDLSLAYFVSRSVQLTVIQPLNSSLAIQGFAARHSLMYDKAAPGAVPINAVTEAGFAVGQRLGRVLRVGVQTEWASATGGQAWDALRVVAFLTWGIGGFQRLDRPIPFAR
jgi:hypothetical protein